MAGWGQSLRGLVPFQRNATVRYDKINMELTAAISTAVTNMGHDETSFLFTVCLDHRMRVWDVRTGQILYTGDIVDLGRDPQDIGKWTIEPSQSNLVRILDRGHGQCLVVTFSRSARANLSSGKLRPMTRAQYTLPTSSPARSSYRRAHPDPRTFGRWRISL